MMPQQAARRIQLASVVALVIASGPASVMAEGGQIIAKTDLEYQYADIESKDDGSGERTDTEFSRLKQRYELELRRELFPFLEFRTGGIFELIDVSTTTDGTDSDSDEKTKWLFAELNLRNPLYTAGTGYRRRNFEFNPSDFAKTEIDREEFTGLFSWRPVGFPIFDLDIESTRTWDRNDTVDLHRDRLIFKSRYDYKDLSSNYTYTRRDADEKINDTGSLNQTHDARVQYSTGFFADRLLLTSEARLNHQLLEPRGGNEIDRPTSPPGAEFFFTDDDDPDTLTPVSPGDPLSTINIGRDGGSDPVSVGLAFGTPTEVNKVHIPILPANDCKYDPSCDGEYGIPANPVQIADIENGYVWMVFWSDDQENWILLDDDAEATYSIIENRFEITFDRIDGARFIKVVTDPQSDDAAGEIRPAAIRAFTTHAVSPGEEIETFDQTYNLGLRWAISDRTEASYDGYYRRSDTQPFDITRNTLTNSIGLRHTLSPIFAADARILRTDTTNTGRSDTTHHSYSASLRADYLETLHQTLIYSGNHDDGGDGTTYANSIFLRTNADLYRGWSSNLDLGYSLRHLLEGGDIGSSTLRLSTDVDPNPKLTFVIDYRFSWNHQTGEPSWLDQNARFQGFWVPLRTLSLSASVRLRYRERDDDRLKVAQTYSVNWAPFPDGLLQFSLGYNRTVDTRNNTTSLLSPQIDLQVTRTSRLSVRFNLGTTETDRATRDVKNVRLNFRTFY